LASFISLNPSIATADCRTVELVRSGQRSIEELPIYSLLRSNIRETPVCGRYNTTQTINNGEQAKQCVEPPNRRKSTQSGGAMTH